MKEQLLVALRVISAFQKHIHPSPADVKLLRDWVDPHEQSLDADELACAIIAAYMKRQNRPIIMRDGDSANASAASPQLFGVAAGAAFLFRDRSLR